MFKLTVFIFFISLNNLYSYLHIVKNGETFWSISRKYNINIDKLLSFNKFKPSETLFAGKKIFIPGFLFKKVYYKVRKGDTLYSIARDRGISIKSLYGINNFSKNKLLLPGDLIFLPNVLKSSKLISPVRGVVVKNFGMHDQIYNLGVTFRSKNLKIKSIYAGRVIFSGFLDGYGNSIIVRHYSGFFSVYASFAMKVIVRNNIWVKGGDEVGAFYRLGDNSLLDFYIWYNGFPVDPLLYIFDYT